MYDKKQELVKLREQLKYEERRALNKEKEAKQQKKLDKLNIKRSEFERELEKKKEKKLWEMELREYKL